MMPQEHHVLKCFSCETFQAHIVKKVRKWECKVCGAKQSLKRNYGKGTGKDCRNHVMKLNELRLTRADNSEEIEGEIFEENLGNYLEEQETKEKRGGKVQRSKWDEYLEENENDSKSDSNEEVEDLFLKTEKTKRVRKLTKGYYPDKKKICMESTTSEILSDLDKEMSPLVSAAKQRFCNIEKSPAKFENKSWKSKYAKYVDKEEHEDNSVEENKFLNIFDSEPLDLGDILNLE